MANKEHGDEMTSSFSLFPGSDKIAVTLFIDVKNAKELKKMIIDGTLKEVSFIDPRFVLSLLQIRVAASKALLNLKNSTLKTNSIYTDILYNLSPSKSIRESLETFGIKDQSTSVIAVTLDGGINDITAKIIQAVDGTPATVEKLTEMSDEARIKKMFDITDRELTIGISLSEAVISRMAVKDVITVKKS